MTAIVAADHLTVRSRMAHPSNWSRVRREPRLIVLHCTQGGEGGGPADLNAAAGLARAMVAGHRSSFHYAVDADSAVQCVPDLHVAWHAGHTANLIGIGVELCGHAEQTRAEWLDATSLATLCNAARLVADLCRAYHIPAVYFDAPALNASNPVGITTHAAVSVAWRESDHWDPGPEFPATEFVAAVATALSATATARPDV